MKALNLVQLVVKLMQNMVKKKKKEEGVAIAYSNNETGIFC